MWVCARQTHKTKYTHHAYMLSHSVVSDSLQPQGLLPARLLCPWDSPGKNTGVHSHSLLLGIFLTQGLNPGLLHCRCIFYLLSYQGSWQQWVWLQTREKGSSGGRGWKGPEQGHGTDPRSHVHSTSPLKTVLILWTQCTKWFLNVITIYIAFMIMLLLNLIRILPEHQIFARRCFVKSTIEFVTTWLSPRQSTGQSCRTNDVGSRWAFPIEPAFNIDLIIFTKDR